MTKKQVFITLIVMLHSVTYADVINHVGVKGSWPSEWTSIPDLNDPNDALPRTHLDFVGDSTDPAAYWAKDADYVYFRVRVAAGTLTAGTFADTIIILVRSPLNVAPDSNQADYAFAWDSSQPLANHGAEMMTYGVLGATWNTTTMVDIDGNSGQKLVNDMNASGRTTDAYVRTDDQQSTTNFGMTSFVDFAVSWNYLETYTSLTRTDQDWEIALASVNLATDHEVMRYDIAGGATPASLPTLGYSESLDPPSPPPGEPVPEPAALLFLGIILLLARNRRMAYC